MADNVKHVFFGKESDRAREKLADELDAISGQIRRGEMQISPDGFVLVLQNQEARSFGVLPIGITKVGMNRASEAILAFLRLNCEGLQE